jgi:hypothetical protein
MIHVMLCLDFRGQRRCTALFWIMLLLPRQVALAEMHAVPDALRSF